MYAISKNIQMSAWYDHKTLLHVRVYRIILALQHDLMIPSIKSFLEISKYLNYIIIFVKKALGIACTGDNEVFMSRSLLHAFYKYFNKLW